LLIIALVLGGGGGGTPEPVLEMIIELAAVIGLVVWIWLPNSPPLVFDRWLWLGLALFVAIPIIQLIPIPAIAWHALPGRAIERQSLALVGADAGWRPISVDAPQTLASLLSLTPPLILLFFASQLGHKSRGILLLVVGLFGLVSAIVGAIQLASGNANWLRFYTFTHLGFATGFMANRNHQADVELIAIAALSSWAWSNRYLLERSTERLLLASALLVLLFSVILTGSRMGTALIVVAAAGSSWALWTVFRPARQHILISVVGFLTVIAIGSVLAMYNPALQRTWSRYEQQREGRFELWPDAAFAAKTYWPVGAGVGNFVPVFKAAENLDAVDNSYPVRAHNDYLEFAIEAGFAGLTLLAVLLVGFFVRTLSILRKVTRRAGGKAQAMFAATAIAVLALHSIVDYPLRTMAASALCALAIALVSRVSVGENNA
jgi:O-antigen ligase